MNASWVTAGTVGGVLACDRIVMFITSSPWPVKGDGPRAGRVASTRRLTFCSALPLRRSPFRVYPFDEPSDRPRDTARTGLPLGNGHGMHAKRVGKFRLCGAEILSQPLQLRR